MNINVNLMNKLISELNNFDFDFGNIPNSRTQQKSKLTEYYVEKCFYSIFGNKIVIYQNGSQQHPDFYVLNKNKIVNNNSFDKFEKEIIKLKDKSKKSLIDRYFSEKDILKIEVKSYSQNESGNFIFNDTLPNPNLEKDTLYIFFDNKKRKVYLNTSFSMSQKENMGIVEKYNKSKESIREAQLKSNEIWKNTSIHTKLRPTYSTKISYFNFQSDLAIKLLEKLNDE